MHNHHPQQKFASFLNQNHNYVKQNQIKITKRKKK